jgi:hypothetical protein
LKEAVDWSVKNDLEVFWQVNAGACFVCGVEYAVKVATTEQDFMY